MTIGRRQFISALGGAAIAWPLVAQAQQSGMRRIGMLSTFLEDDSEGKARIEAFLQALQGLGWIDGQNYKIDYRWTAADLDRIRSPRRNSSPYSRIF